MAASRLVRVVVAALATYGIAWLVAYLVLVGPDLDLLARYFVWSWTGGLETPAVIQAIAVTSALVAMIVAAITTARPTATPD